MASALLPLRQLLGANSFFNHKKSNSLKRPYRSEAVQVYRVLDCGGAYGPCIRSDN